MGSSHAYRGRRFHFFHQSLTLAAPSSESLVLGRGFPRTNTSLMPSSSSIVAEASDWFLSTAEPPGRPAGSHTEQRPGVCLLALCGDSASAGDGVKG